MSTEGAGPLIDWHTGCLVADLHQPHTNYYTLIHRVMAPPDATQRPARWWAEQTEDLGARANTPILRDEALSRLLLYRDPVRWAKAMAKPIGATLAYAWGPFPNLLLAHRALASGEDSVLGDGEVGKALEHLGHGFGLLSNFGGGPSAGVFRRSLDAQTVACAALQATFRAKTLMLEAGPPPIPEGSVVPRTDHTPTVARRHAVRTANYLQDALERLRADARGPADEYLPGWAFRLLLVEGWEAVE